MQAQSGLAREKGKLKTFAPCSILNAEDLHSAR